MLAKIRHYVNLKTLKNIYYSIFNSHLTYGCQIWGQNLNQSLNRIQNKALRVICFENPTANSNKLYSELRILRYHDYVDFLNISFVYEYIKKQLPKAFDGIITYIAHRYNTRSNYKKLLQLPRVKSTKYGLKSIIYNSLTLWNKLTNENIISEQITKSKLKHQIYNFKINNYTQN